jgi:hypothetical protein
MKMTGHIGRVLLASGSLWAVLACATPPATHLQEKKQMDTPAPEMVINTGTVGAIGACRVGVRSVDAAQGTASVALMRQGVKEIDRNDYVARAVVRRGNLLPVCGQLYRVLEVAGVGRGAIRLDARPVAVAGVDLQADGFVIPLGQTGELHGLEIEVTAIENGRAKLALWPNDYEKKDAATRQAVKTAEAFAGADLDIGGQKHRVLSVVAPNQEGLSGWLEIQAAPSK